MNVSRDRQWLVERVALGEAPADTTLTASEQQRLAELTADDEAIRSMYSKGDVSAEVRRRQRVEAVRARSELRRGWPMLASGLAATAAVALWVFVPGGAKDPGAIARMEQTRLKGAGLILHRKTAEGSDTLISGERARAGDRIQIGYRLDQASFAVLLSVDGRGVVTYHVPSDGRFEPVQRDAGHHQLSFSYQLDDAPAFERFFLVTSDRAFAIAEVRRAAARLSQKPRSVALTEPLALPGGLSQLDFVLIKGDIR